MTETRRSRVEQDHAERGARGAHRAAFVCTHILQTLRDGRPRGFLWSRDEDGAVNAYCALCDAELRRAGAEWDEAVTAFADVKLISEDEAASAAMINGVVDLRR